VSAHPRPPTPAPGGRAAALVAGALVLRAAAAPAHTGGQAFIMLLPTHLYVAGGAVAVAASFALLALVPARAFEAARRLRVELPRVLPPAPVRKAASVGASLASLALIAVLVVAGVARSRDPLANPLPLVVWSVWWIGLAGAHALAGDLWAHVNPWSGLHRALTGLPALRRWRQAPPLAYPAAIGHWPAVAFLLAFAWFELIHPAPADPAILAGAVSAYLLAHAAGTAVFGPRDWLGYAEPFSLFFRVIAWIAPLGGRPPSWSGGADHRAPAPPPAVTLPAMKLLDVGPPPPGGIAFVLLALASVSFDGLSRTFTWLGWLGVNPLDYPGRTALMGPNTAGLLVTFAALALAYTAVAHLAGRLGAFAIPARAVPGALVLSIVPIAVAYHFAHYLSAFLVDVQHAAKAASDPFARGWDLFGTRDLAVVASLVTDPERVYAIWHTQVAIIVAGHVTAVWVAHALALRLAPTTRRAVLSQAPLTVLMIAYTILGLWLLASPTAG
jgi:hypothetical protein